MKERKTHGMTPRQKKLHAYYVKLCHTIKKNRFADDETRRDYLCSEFNATSFKELTITELQEVAKFLGFTHKEYKKEEEVKRIQPPKGAKMPPLSATQEQVKTIEAIWFKVAREKTELALRRFINRIVKKSPVYLNCLTRAQAQKIITALSEMQKDWSKAHDS
ncbi:MAG: regulatory protein GemA [Campylobacteraceae bacterium]|jgi:hypothetical protein|nr:regulatory protein GemA [Campylobacteraceae bacterium]